MEVEAEAEVEEGVERAERLWAVIPNILILVSGDFFFGKQVRLGYSVECMNIPNTKERKGNVFSVSLLLP